MPSHTFGKSQRVRRRSQFQQAFSAGYRVSSRYFTLVILPGAAVAATADPAAPLTGWALLGMTAARG